jgi:hypothetical protein
MFRVGMIVQRGNFGAGAIIANGGLQWASGNTGDISSRLAPLVRGPRGQE